MLASTIHLHNNTQTPTPTHGQHPQQHAGPEQSRKTTTTKKVMGLFFQDPTTCLPHQTQSVWILPAGGSCDVPPMSNHHRHVRPVRGNTNMC